MPGQRSVITLDLRLLLCSKIIAGNDVYYRGNVTLSPVVTKDYHVVQLDLCESPSREVYTVTERMRFGEKAGEMFER